MTKTTNTAEIKTNNDGNENKNKEEIEMNNVKELEEKIEKLEESIKGGKKKVERLKKEIKTKEYQIKKKLKEKMKTVEISLDVINEATEELDKKTKTKINQSVESIREKLISEDLLDTKTTEDIAKEIAEDNDANKESSDQDDDANNDNNDEEVVIKVGDKVKIVHNGQIGRVKEITNYTPLTYKIINEDGKFFSPKSQVELLEKGDVTDVEEDILFDAAFEDSIGSYTYNRVWVKASNEEDYEYVGRLESINGNYIEFKVKDDGSYDSSYQFKRSDYANKLDAFVKGAISRVEDEEKIENNETNEDKTNQVDLTKVNGIGQKTADRIIDKIEDITKASVNDFAEVNYVSQELAKNIVDYISQQ